MSNHFKDTEFACPCCARISINSQLISALESLRTAAGNVSIRIISGFRCPEQNKKIGGAPNSLHTCEQAAHIMIHGRDVYQSYIVAAKVPAFRNGGIGLYPDEKFIHVDIRKEKPARWGKVKGEYCSLRHVLLTLDIAPHEMITL